MGDSTDPFAAPQPHGTTPAQGPHIPPPPYAAPPPYGQPYPPQSQQYPSQYGQPYPPSYPPPYGDPYAMQYGGYVPIKWKRSWGITMGRWGIACGVLFVVSMVVGAIAGSGQPTAEAAGEVAGAFFAGALLYMPLIPWWLDHVVWRLGKAGTWAIQGAASGLLALVWLAILAAPTTAGEEPFLPPDVGAWWMLVVWAVGFPLSMVLADLLPRSYGPKRTA